VALAVQQDGVMGFTNFGIETLMELIRMHKEKTRQWRRTLATGGWLELAYKQHAAVDDKVGVILDVEVTTGQTNEGDMIEPQVEEIQVTTGIDIKTVTAMLAMLTRRHTARSSAVASMR